jgi:cold shock CspA family protein
MHGVRVSKVEDVPTVYKQTVAAINDAFDAARRVLQDHIRRQRGDIKKHEETPHGMVVKLFRKKGYGYLKTPNGRRLFFERQNMLATDFEKLKVGTRVNYAEEEGEKGPEAVLIRIAGSPKKALTV